MNVSNLFINISKNYTPQLLLFSLILVFSGLLETIGLIFLAPIFDNILGNDLAESSFITQKIYLIFQYFEIQLKLEILFLIFIISTLFTAIFSTLCVYYSEQIKYSYGHDLMSQTLKNIFSLKWSFFTKTKQGSLLNILNRELTIIINTLSVFARMIANLVQIFIILILPFLISWKLVFIMILTLLIIFSPLILITNKAKRIGVLDTEAHKNFLSYLQETFSGLKIILGNSVQNIVKVEALKKYSTLIKIAIIRAVLFITISNATLPLIAIGFTALYYLSFNFLDVKLVELTVVAASFVRISSKAGQILREKAVLQTSIASLKELNFINKFDRKFLVRNGNISINEFKSKIDLINVNYSYQEKNLVLKKCNLEIKKGNFVGIVGESGSGKSTIIDLIMGFDFPKKGQLKVDNVNIEKLNLESYRKKIGYISQDSILFNTTILRNILWMKPNIKKKMVQSFINKSKAFSFINELPQGLNTIVGDRGVSLSGGQIQRIALIRALIDNPEIIILDEATSALDEANEKYIMEFLYKFMKTKTIIIISHRLNALKGTDIIYLLKKGKIIEKGNYSKLKNNKKSNFYKILNSKKKI